VSALKDVIGTCPQTKQQVIDTYFMEHRAKLMDISAYLDRVDRGQGDDQKDFRATAFIRAIEILTDGETHRARRILNLLSDHTTTMAQSAEGMKGASGAVPLTDGGVA
jgi:outer membrane PBP1 activator LpoA protein